MSNQPTPETDAAAWVETNQANALVLASFACNLERQRDAAISRFESSQSARMELKRERDEARELARQLIAEMKRLSQWEFPIYGGDSGIEKPCSPAQYARLLRRVQELENIVARLERDSHPPVNLSPAIAAEVTKQLKANAESIHPESKP
jgi:hypothetical protein